MFFDRFFGQEDEPSEVLHNKKLQRGYLYIEYLCQAVLYCISKSGSITLEMRFREWTKFLI